MGKYISPIRQAKEVLLGTMFGDGSLHSRSEHSARLHFGHSKLQFEYFVWKMSQLSPLVDSFTVHERKNGGFSKGSLFLARSLSSKYLKHVYDDFYRFEDGKNIKHVYINVLRRLTARGIAIWYMDDGCLVKYKDNPWSVRFCTHGFSKQENELIVKYFKETHDIDFHVLPQDGKFFIDSGKNSCLKFIDLIKPYMHESMLYKIDPSFHKPEHPIKDDDVLQTLQECKELIRNNQPAVYSVK